MIYHLHGEVVLCEHDFTVLDVNGVGYKLTVSQNTAAYVRGHMKESLKLLTYMSVREDAVELFGFRDADELTAFKLLITVSGVGPKAAISILSLLSPQKLAVAICSDDKKTISKANGIGPKTAARIILELKDKLKADGIGEAEVDSSSPLAEVGVGAKNTSKLSDAQDALVVLGYSRNEALKALQTIDTNALELDDIIRLALKKLMK